MTASFVFTFGVVVGLLIALAVVLAHLVRYVSSDLEAYTRYLDRDPGALA